MVKGPFKFQKAQENWSVGPRGLRLQIYPIRVDYEGRFRGDWPVGDCFTQSSTSSSSSSALSVHSFSFPLSHTPVFSLSTQSCDMQDTLHLSPSTTTAFPLPPNFSSKQSNFAPNPIQKHLQFPTLSSATAVSLPPKPLPSIPASVNARSDFREKMLFLDSIGVDFISLASSHPHIAAASLSDLRQIIDFLTSIGLSTADLCRIASMCPEILSLTLPSLQRVTAFLQREAGIETSKLRHAIHRRPRLLVSSVETRLQPSLDFLKSIGVTEINRHTSLLSCSVEEKFIPRMEYLEKIGFSREETISMVGRFPAMLRYSMEENLEPKLKYFVVEMGRELRELVDFPEYFSFSLENRIKVRHQRCVEKGVSLSLQTMLKSKEEGFGKALEEEEEEEVSCTSSVPSRNLNLWITSNNNEMIA